MKKLWVLIILLLLTACSLPSPVTKPLPDISQVWNEAYQQGYNDGQTIAWGQLPCCDLCIIYPTRQQVLDFILQDDTNTLPFSINSFVCTDYCQQINERAWAAGIPCYTVWITFEYDYLVGHAIVAFPICEGGSVTLMYIEPQTDGEVEIDMGGEYPVCKGDYCELRKINRVRIFK